MLQVGGVEGDIKSFLFQPRWTSGYAGGNITWEVGNFITGLRNLFLNQDICGKGLKSCEPPETWCKEIILNDYIKKMIILGGNLKSLSLPCAFVEG